jgi:hypothetical protein
MSRCKARAISLLRVKCCGRLVRVAEIIISAADFERHPGHYQRLLVSAEQNDNTMKHAEAEETLLAIGIAVVFPRD